MASVTHQKSAIRPACGPAGARAEEAVSQAPRVRARANSFPSARTDSADGEMAGWRDGGTGAAGHRAASHALRLAIGQSARTRWAECRRAGVEEGRSGAAGFRLASDAAASRTAGAPEAAGNPEHVRVAEAAR